MGIRVGKSKVLEARSQIDDVSETDNNGAGIELAGFDDNSCMVKISIPAEYMGATQESLEKVAEENEGIELAVLNNDDSAIFVVTKSVYEKMMKEYKEDSQTFYRRLFVNQIID